MKGLLDEPDEKGRPWWRRRSWRLNWVLILFFGLGWVFSPVLESPPLFGTLFMVGVVFTAAMAWLLVQY
jgi:hypothetical protein